MKLRKLSEAEQVGYAAWWDLLWRYSTMGKRRSQGLGLRNWMSDAIKYFCAA